MTLRQPRPEGWYHRGGRPWIIWCGGILAVLAIITCGWFLFRVLDAIAVAFERAAANGNSVPDMSGGLPALITAFVGLLSMIMPQVINAMTARNRERRDQIARGQAPGPFDSSPAEGGPRPQENIPP